MHGTARQPQGYGEAGAQARAHKERREGETEREEEENMTEPRVRGHSDCGKARRLGHTRHSVHVIVNLSQCK